MVERRSGEAAAASEALPGPLPAPPNDEAQLVPRYTKPELNALALDAYQSQDPAKLAVLGALRPADKAYLASRPEFQTYIVALMFDSVIGNERVTKCQRASATWFHRVINDQNAPKDKARRVSADVEIEPAGGDK